MIKTLKKLIRKKMREGGTIQEIPYNEKEDNKKIKKDKVIMETMRRLSDK